MERRGEEGRGRGRTGQERRREQERLAGPWAWLRPGSPARHALPTVGDKMFMRVAVDTVAVKAVVWRGSTWRGVAWRWGDSGCCLV